MIKNGNKISYIYKVGNNDRPATQEDIEAVEELIERSKQTGRDYVVTHHAVEVIKLEGEDPELVSAEDPKQMKLFE